MKKSKVIIFLLVLLFGLQTSCQAIEFLEGLWRAVNLDPEELQGVIVGAGVLYSPSVYEGVDDSLQGIPFVIGKYKKFYFNGISLGYLLNENEHFILSAFCQPRFGGYDADDSSALSGMEERTWSLDGGLSLNWNTDWFLLKLSAKTDLLSEYHGHEVKLVASKEFFRGGFTPRAGVKWQSDNLVEYYYGVAGTEARSGRPAYDGGSTFNAVAGFSVAYPLGDKWALVGDFEYEWLGSEIQDSPIVDAETDLTSSVGLVYRF